MGGSRLKSRLNELFNYDPNTGNFTRKICVAGYRSGFGEVAGSKDKNGYVNISVDGIKYKAHRLAWLVMHGHFPALELDHINRNRADNRIANLREVTSEQNKWNTKIHSHNVSGVKGVSWDTKKKMWRASITHRNKFKHLGFYRTVAEAKQAREETEKEIRGANWGLAG